MNQYTLNFEPSLPERFPTLREYVAHRSTVVQKMPKTQAADMDMAPSTLSRKLNPSDGDTQRFNVDDLEAWLRSTRNGKKSSDPLRSAGTSAKVWACGFAVSRTMARRWCVLGGHTTRLG